jgi:hypothetical protein
MLKELINNLKYAKGVNKAFPSWTAQDEDILLKKINKFFAAKKNFFHFFVFPHFLGSVLSFKAGILETSYEHLTVSSTGTVSRKRQ